MQAFSGELLIGGLRLTHLHGELDNESPQPDSDDWQLSGRLQLPTQLTELLQLDREYRLQLNDGRAGQVVVTKIRAAGDAEQLVYFRALEQPAFAKSSCRS